jgi:hypothetical protein
VSLICSQACELIELGSNTSRRGSPTSPTHGIRTLNADVLLDIFDLYRLANADEYYDGTMMVISWTRQRWWYDLAHVCRQWRDIILQSPSRLDLHLVCTHGVPVAKMLAHSPPLPLVILYNYTDSDQGPVITAKDESGILLALSHRDRVRRVLFRRLPNLGKYIKVMDGQFPILERLYISSKTALVLPVTFQAPNLHRLGLKTVSLPIGSPLLTTTTGVTYLHLSDIPESAYFPPSYLLARLSVMLQLEILRIEFRSPPPNLDVERQPPHTPRITQVALPSLHRFVYLGVATYLDGLVDRIRAPSLNSLIVDLFKEPPVTVPHLLRFLQSSENLIFSAFKVAFKERSVKLDAVTQRSPRLESHILCRDIDSQVASVVDILSVLSPVLSVVKKVTLTDNVVDRSPAWLDDVGRGQWRELLRPFINVKAIHVHKNLVEKIFHSLLPAEGEPPLELLPNLDEVRYFGGLQVVAQDAVSAFINARRVEGRLVSLHIVESSVIPDDSDVDVN